MEYILYNYIIPGIAIFIISTLAILIDNHRKKFREANDLLILQQYREQQIDSDIEDQEDIEDKLDWQATEKLDDCIYQIAKLRKRINELEAS